LLDLAYDFEGSGRVRVVVDGERVFQPLPRDKVAQTFSGIRYTRHSEQVTLLANAVAGGGHQFGWIHDTARDWLFDVPLRRSVATFACDGLVGKYRLTILIQGAGNVQCGSGMAEKTFFADGTSEVGILLMLESRDQRVRLAAVIVREGRLENVAATQIHQVTAGVIARTNDVADTIVGLFLSILPMLPVAGRQRVHGYRGSVRGYRAVGFMLGTS